jgi:hypothetical protein
MKKLLCKLGIHDYIKQWTWRGAVLERLWKRCGRCEKEEVLYEIPESSVCWEEE